LVIRGEHSVIPPAGKGADPCSRPQPGVRVGPRGKDTLEISERSKHLNSEQTVDPGGVRQASSMESGVSRIRAEIRHRVKSGFYDSEEVLNRVAQRLLDLFGL
jgi:hypothetical protein